MRLPLALINNSLTPYRIHLHVRLARELPEAEIWSVFTHEISNAPWRLQAPTEIRPVFFGAREESLAGDRLSAQPREWKKAGTMIRWFAQQGIRAVVLGGYNDLGRLRILRWCHHAGIPCFLFGDSNIHCDSGTGWRAKVKRLCLPYILRRCAGVLCCGELGEEYFLRYRVPKNRLFRFPYEPDYGRFMNVPEGLVQSIRLRFGLTATRKYLIYSGRLAPAKRVDLLIQAFINIAPIRPEWGLIIVGDGDLRQPLKASVPEDLHHRIIWAGFINDVDEMAALYAAAHVLALPSDYEPWGVVITEAAVRMPVVASAAAGAAEVIRDGVNGRIFEPGKLDSLEACLLDVTQPEVISRMTAAAPECFDSWHSTADPVSSLRSALASAGLV